MLLQGKNKVFDKVITLSGSKSESNRVLIIQALCSETFFIGNLADADDTKVLNEALKNYQHNKIIDVHHAGTAYRFLTAFLASCTSGSWLLTGSERMQQRPVKILVDALKSLGASIEYEDKQGFPPLEIRGGELKKNEVVIDGSVSSQYLSALLLIAPILPDGLNLQLVGGITSRPYLEMTLSMMNYFGVEHSWNGDKILVRSQSYQAKDIRIEADWSAASYWYSLVALSPMGSRLRLNGLNEKSLQGDAVLKEIYSAFGVKSTYSNGGWIVQKVNDPEVSMINLDLNEAPDIAQTILCTCAGLGVGARITGLKTLKIKETDRVSAMQNELNKFGVRLEILSDEEVYLAPNQAMSCPSLPLETYQDHRMAMAFAPLSLLMKFEIRNPEVVSKSYPNFWEDFKLATR